jgi:hypothetical protein
MMTEMMIAISPSLLNPIVTKVMMIIRGAPRTAWSFAFICRLRKKIESTKEYLSEADFESKQY